MVDDDDPLEYEEKHVHSIYESIASHFSSTRYKPWPVVDAFLRALRPGCVGLDIGCGNGKYLNVNKGVFIVGSDRSSSLIALAKDNQLDIGKASPHDVVVADTLSLPHADGQYDFAICIAVIHHLSSTQRRVVAIQAILATLRQPRPGSEEDIEQQEAQSAAHQSVSKVGNCTADNLPLPPKAGCGPGQALIFVWALEQSSSRRGWKEGDDQDVLVPWVLKKAAKASRAPTKANGESPGTERSLRETAVDDNRTMDEGSAQVNDVGQPKDKVFNRYYHLYRQGELESECRSAGGEVIASGYDKDNWWAMVEPGR